MAITVEQLLATLGIDEASVEVTSAGRYVLIQRDPQPDETDIDIGTDVVFMLVDLDGDPTDPALPDPTFGVNIEGSAALQYVSGTPTWISPWTGTVEKHTVSSPFAFWKVTAQQIGAVFQSEQEVTVEVNILGGSGWGHASWGHFPWGHPPAAAVSQSFTYTFTIEDLTPPKLVAVEAIDQTTVRVTFDDQMTVATVQDILNWVDSIERQNIDPVPGVTLDVVGVSIAEPLSAQLVPIAWVFADSSERLAAHGFEPTDVGMLAFQESDSTYWMLTEISTSPPSTWVEVLIGQQFDLTVNWEMTPGCRYQVTVNPAVEDDSGNSIDPDFDVNWFTGFQPEVPECRRFSHWKHMVPEDNKRQDATRDLERFSGCIDEVLKLLLHDVDRFTDQFDPDKATPEQIDAMLYDMGNPFGQCLPLELTDIQKKKLLRILVDIYKSKGTAWGIEQTIFFLIGEVVEVVEYMAGGWILGVDALGGAAIAEVLNDMAETYDFTIVSSPWTLTVKVDGGGEQTVTFQPTDFAAPGAATAKEVIAVLDAQLSGAQAYEVYPGQAATVAGTILGPYGVSPGDVLDIDVDGSSYQVKFQAADIATPGSATTDEIAERISLDLPGVLTATNENNTVRLTTVTRSDTATLQVQAGPVQAVLGLLTAEFKGGDDAQVAIYSLKVGVEASIEVTGGSANSILDFDTQAFGSTGGAVLAPDDSYTLYSFDIETENVLSSEQEEIVRCVAEYMKPAHTHLINVRQALPLPWPDGWMMGVDELDVSTELAE